MKFNKRKCYDCMCHAEHSCGTTVEVDNRHVNVLCNYACATGETCLTQGANHTIIDRRGDEYDNCKLFKRGVALTVKSKM